MGPLGFVIFLPMFGFGQWFKVVAAKLGGPASDPAGPDSSTATADGSGEETARLIPPTASVPTASGSQDVASASSRGSASGGPSIVKDVLVRQAWGGVKSVWSASKAFVVDGTVVGEVVGPPNPEADGAPSGGAPAGAGAGVGATVPSAAVAPKTPSRHPSMAGAGGDVEAGPASATPGAASKLKAGFAAVVSTKVLVSGFLAEKAGVVKAALPVALGGAEAPAVEEETYCGLTRCQRIQAFVILFSVAIALMALAVIVFLPMILFAPSKFALCFTTGSLCFMAAFASFSGPVTFAKGLFAKDRVWFAVGYVGSLFFSLYAALFAQSYFLVMASAIAQVSALAWYAASYFPYGRTGMAMLTKACGTGLRRVCWPCLKATSSLCR